MWNRVGADRDLRDSEHASAAAVAALNAELVELVLRVESIPRRDGEVHLIASLYYNTVAEYGPFPSIEYSLLGDTQYATILVPEFAERDKNLSVLLSIIEQLEELGQHVEGYRTTQVLKALELFRNGIEGLAAAPERVDTIVNLAGGSTPHFFELIVQLTGSDLSLRNRLSAEVEAIFDASGNGVWAGADVGSGTMNLFFDIDDVERAKRDVLKALKKTKTSHLARIAWRPSGSDEDPVSLWPTANEPFSY